MFIVLCKNEEKMMPNSQNYEKLRNRYLNLQSKKKVYFPLKMDYFPKTFKSIFCCLNSQIHFLVHFLFHKALFQLTRNESNCIFSQKIEFMQWWLFHSLKDITSILSTNYKVPGVFSHMTDDKAVATFKSEKRSSLLGKNFFFSVKNGPFL